MDKLKKVLSGQDTEDRGGLAEVSAPPARPWHRLAGAWGMSGGGMARAAGGGKERDAGRALGSGRPRLFACVLHPIPSRRGRPWS